MGFPFTLEFIFENRGHITTFLFFFYSYRKLRMSNFQNLASPKSEFYYVKGKRRFRTNKIEQGNSSSFDISKQVQLSKHELSNMRRSQVWTKIPFKLCLLAFSHNRFELPFVIFLPRRHVVQLCGMTN